MNPATPGPLTVLLIPPEGDAALLAYECGGRVPQAWRWTLPGEPKAWTLTPIPSWVNPLATESALLLVHEGAPVAMGIDRAARVLTDRTVARVNAAGTGTIRAFSVQSRYRVERHGPMQPWGVLDLCDAWTSEGARIVLLRDGQEVTE